MGDEYWEGGVGSAEMWKVRRCGKCGAVRRYEGGKVFLAARHGFKSVMYKGKKGNERGGGCRGARQRGEIGGAVSERVSG